MSILIKGMEMPTSCDDCRLNNGISCYAVPEYTEDGRRLTMAYIDRDAAVMTAMDYDGNGNAQDASQDIASAIGDIPPADVVPVVHGEWVWIEPSDVDAVYDWICSVCGEKNYWKSNYCPDCGAKMDGGDNYDD